MPSLDPYPVNSKPTTLPGGAHPGDDEAQVIGGRRRAAGSDVRLGLRANWQQFTLLVIVNAFVGGMVGLERSVVPPARVKVPVPTGPLVITPPLTTLLLPSCRVPALTVVPPL